MTSETLKTEPLKTGRILTEFAVLAVAIYAAWYAFTAFIYPAMGLSGGAPVPARTIVALILIAVYLRASGETFADIGFFRPNRVWLAILLGFVLLAYQISLMQEIIIFLTQGFEERIFDYEFFQHLKGSELALAGWLVIVWTTAAFGEEIFFRGYLIQRITALLGGSTTALWLGVVGQAVLFGIGHAYQGPVGAVGSTIMAFSFGAFYVVIGRNLWPLIIAHGVYDTLGVVLIYFNGVPTTEI